MTDSAGTLHRKLIKSGLQARLPGSQRSVLSVLIAYANTHLDAWPSVATIADEAGTTRRSVQLALRALVAAELIEQVAPGGGRRSARYRLRPDNWAAEFTASADSAGAARGAMARAPGAQWRAPQGRNGARPRGAMARAAGAQWRAPEVPIEVPIEASAQAPTPEPAAPEPAPPPPEPSLFDAAAAAELLQQRGFQPADARTQVAKFGVAAVRRAVDHADFLRLKGEIRKSYRGTVVQAMREAWPVDERLIAQQRAQAARRKADAAAERQRAEAERRRDELAAAERRDELLWSQLTGAQRDELHRAVLARLPAASRPFHQQPDSRAVRPLILREARERGIA